jgi:hypothetical protein
MIYLKCPGCGKRLGLDDTSAGALGECPACGKQFRVPEKTAEAPPPEEDDEPVEAEEADDEPLDAELVDEGGERRKRRPQRRRRRPRPELQYRQPLYMQAPRRGGSSLSGQKILGLIGLILGGLMIAGDILVMASNTGQGGPVVLIPGGLCGVVLLLGGGYLFLRGD